MLDPKFLKRMKNLLSDEGLKDYLDELERPSPRALRINKLKCSSECPERLLGFDISPVPYADSSYYFSYDKIGSHPMHHAGLIYVQEPAAMVPVASLDIQSDWKIFDTCSAPGGKSLQASSFLSDDGFILSNEINMPRAKVMAGNFERMGVKNSVITSAPVADVAKLYRYYFDLVIVDAPCSGEGMFRKEADAVRDWSEENVKMCAERQAGILQSASQSVRGGGYLIYSTCTFAPEENEYLVDAFLENNSDFELLPPNERIIGYTVSGIGSDKYRRFYPHISKGEGQFCALLHRKGNEYETPDIKNALSELTSEERKCTEQFLCDTLIEYDPDRIKKFKDSIVYIRPDIPVPAGVTYSCGVTLGEVRRGYFQPHHQLFSAMGGLFKRKIELVPDDPRLSSYLKGEGFAYDISNGWCAVFADGIALGGAKCVQGQIKNHYPKGLRIMH